ncbi:MAG: hypothetical protein CMJ77_07975 [Planctomycetaceae bacterium]|nr:hypothetical protein [Planctomycetaceae bacterium]
MFERERVVPRILLFALVLCGVCSPVSAQEWARKMFNGTNHDFGTVARASQTDFVFELQNIYKEKIHIAGVRTSCGCVTPTITKPTLDTWEKGGIRAKFNTHSFLGLRTATITVTIDKPYYAEVQLSIRGIIRGDVVFDPGIVNFDSVDFGEQAKRNVDVSYAGRSDWKIVDILSANTNLVVTPVETRRNNGRVAYELQVQLKPETPAGYFNDEMILITNDRRSEQIPIRVEGLVESPITVSPAALSLGTLEPGQTVTKNIVVRSKKPFRITNVNCEDDCFEFVPTDEFKPLHLVPVKFTAANTPGKISEEIEIETDLGNGTAGKILATATVRDESE